MIFHKIYLPIFLPFMTTKLWLTSYYWCWRLFFKIRFLDIEIKILLAFYLNWFEYVDPSLELCLTSFLAHITFIKIKNKNQINVTSFSWGFRHYHHITWQPHEWKIRNRGIKFLRREMFVFYFFIKALFDQPSFKQPAKPAGYNKKD